MKRFQFPLDRVRRWRAEQAEIEELKLRQLWDQLAALEAQRRHVESDRARSEREVLQQPFILPSEFQSLEAYARHTANQIRDIESRAQQCQAQILEQRQRVIDARQKAELLDRLKENALAEWRLANDREEEGLAAELFLAKRPRR